jgi:enoyl-CoA hydratase/carnithine racemase
MPDAQYVRVERRGAVALLRLDRPKVNALSLQVLAEIRSAVAGLAADPPGALVVWGGERVFAAGADIRELQVAEPVQVSEAFRAALDELAALPRLTIAAINGVALGGGCELALACDLRIAASDARLGQPEIQLGIIPGGGATQRLARAVGSARAKELILTGRHVGADEAHAIGLVQRVVEPAAVLDTSLELASSVARGALAAQALAKRAVDDGLDVPLREGLDLEARLFAKVMTTEDSAIGFRSFLEHGAGKAVFTGR